MIAYFVKLVIETAFYIQLFGDEMVDNIDQTCIPGSALNMASSRYMLFAFSLWQALDTGLAL